MSYNVLYIRHNVKVFCIRAYSTNKYRDKYIPSVFVYTQDNRDSYGTIQGVQTPSVSLPSGRVKIRSNTTCSWEKDCVYSKTCREFGSAVTGVCRKNREIIKRPNSRSFVSLSQKRKKAWLRRVARRRSNCITVLIVWRLRSSLMYIRYWFRRKEPVEPKGILA
jgi:hypothetical protein